jgi:hypothetical protein
MADVAAHLAYPAEKVSAAERYRYAYGVFEALRLKHNTRAGDLGPEAVAFRAECMRHLRRAQADILALRPAVATPDWKGTKDDYADPALELAKAEGKSAQRDADLKSAIGVDLDAFRAIAELPPDPLEVFTSYTEVDETGCVTAATNTVTATGINRNEDSALYDDKGAGALTNFLHRLHFKPTWIAQNSACCSWAVSNVVNTSNYWKLNSSQALDFQVYSLAGSTYRADLRNEETDTYDRWSGPTNNTDYYPAAWKDGSTAGLDAYSDSDRTVLVDALTVTVVRERTYRYVFPLRSVDYNLNATMTLVSSNLDLQHTGHYYLDVDGDGATGQWTKNGAATSWECLEPDIYPPDVPNFAAGTSLTSNSNGQVVEMTLETFTLPAGTEATEIMFPVNCYASGAGGDNIQIQLYDGASWQAAQDLDPDTSYGWVYATFSGLHMDQTAVNAGQVRFISVIPIGGGVGIEAGPARVTVAAVEGESYEADVDGGVQLQVPGAVAGTQAHAADVDGGVQVQAPGAASGTQAHAADVDGGVQAQAPGDPSGQEDSGEVSADVDGGVQLQVPGQAGGTQAHAADVDGGVQLQAPGAAGGTQAHAADVDGGVQVQAPGDPSGQEDSEAVSADVDGGVQAQVPGDAEGHVEVALLLSVPVSTLRRLSWAMGGTVYVVIDGALAAESAEGYVDLAADVVARGILVAYAELFTPLPTPRDEVLLTVSGDPVLHHIERRPSGGSWGEIAAILGDSYRDGPLDDGDYDYRAVAEDEEGDEATGNTQSVTISSMPDPPSGLDYEWDGETQTLVVSWTASPSADVASYRVRSSAGDELLELTAAPVQESAGLTWTKVFTDETGQWIVNVRAVDADGNEEANISRTISLTFTAGLLVAAPVEPDSVCAVAASGGKIEVGWLYRPWKEAPPGTGAAYEARVYGDSGTGTVDWDTPLDTVLMDGPTSEAAYAWTSGALTDGVTYRFGVRIATAAWPDGVETQNLGVVYATADSDVPATPELTAQVV